MFNGEYIYMYYARAHWYCCHGDVTCQWFLLEQTKVGIWHWCVPALRHPIDPNLGSLRSPWTLDPSSNSARYWSGIHAWGLCIVSVVSSSASGDCWWARWGFVARDVAPCSPAWSLVCGSPDTQRLAKHIHIDTVKTSDKGHSEIGIASLPYDKLKVPLYMHSM